MTDKVQKIREEVERLQKRTEHNLDTSLTENERQFWLGESNVLTLIGKYIDSLQKEPKECMYSKDHYTDEDRKVLCDGCEEECKYAQKEEPVSEDLEEVCNQMLVQARISKYEAGNPFFSDGDYKLGFKDGAKWQKEKEYTCYEEAFEDGAAWKVENLWKPADGDDLPEIDREVIALLDNGKVVFAHRPPEYWDGKNIVTGKVTRNYPKTYDKGGWNIPNIVYWLNLELPNEKED